jgi:hypothetical protein
LEDTEARDTDSFALLKMLCDNVDEAAEEGFTCSFRQLMLLGQSRGKVLERNGTAGFGCSGWVLCLA